MSKNEVVCLLAFLFGFGGWIFVFSDLGPGETWPARIAIASAYFLLTGGTIGFLHPRGWLIALLISWAAVLMGGFIIFIALIRYGTEAFAAAEPPYVTSGLVMVFGSLVMALFGGILGRLLARILTPVSPQ